MTPDHRVVPIPHPDAPPGVCRWCGDRITYGHRRRRRWHDGRRDEPECFRDYTLVRDHDAYRAHRRMLGSYECADCSTELGVLEVDHVVPLIDGGPHAVDNLDLRCPRCHRRKTSREASARALRRRQRIRDAQRAMTAATRETAA